MCSSDLSDLNSEGAFGFAGTRLIQLDDDALGYGWHVGSGPVPTSAVDLGTVMRHELGHILGLSDLDPATAGEDLMAGTILPGQRRAIPVLPTAGVVDLPLNDGALTAQGRPVELFREPAETRLTTAIQRDSEESAEVAERELNSQSGLSESLNLPNLHSVSDSAILSDKEMDLNLLDSLFLDPLENLFGF